MRPGALEVLDHEFLSLRDQRDRLIDMFLSFSPLNDLLQSI